MSMWLVVAAVSVGVIVLRNDNGEEAEQTSQLENAKEETVPEPSVNPVAADQVILDTTPVFVALVLALILAPVLTAASTLRALHTAQRETSHFGDNANLYCWSAAVASIVTGVLLDSHKVPLTTFVAYLSAITLLVATVAPSKIPAISVLLGASLAAAFHIVVDQLHMRRDTKWLSVGTWFCCFAVALVLSGVTWKEWLDAIDVRSAGALAQTCTNSNECLRRGHMLMFAFAGAAAVLLPLFPDAVDPDRPAASRANMRTVMQDSLRTTGIMFGTVRPRDSPLVTAFDRSRTQQIVLEELRARAALQKQAIEAQKLQMEAETRRRQQAQAQAQYEQQVRENRRREFEQLLQQARYRKEQEQLRQQREQEERELRERQLREQQQRMVRQRVEAAKQRQHESMRQKVLLSKQKKQQQMQRLLEQERQQQQVQLQPPQRPAVPPQRPVPPAPAKQVSRRPTRAHGPPKRPRGRPSRLRRGPRPT
ncbi:MAG: hypothetical protein MHM6MM_005034 [Cercozoa sp. M6MM]